MNTGTLLAATSPKANSWILPSGKGGFPLLQCLDVSRWWWWKGKCMVQTTLLMSFPTHVAGGREEQRTIYGFFLSLPVCCFLIQKRNTLNLYKPRGNRTNHCSKEKVFVEHTEEAHAVLTSPLYSSISPPPNCTLILFVHFCPVKPQPSLETRIRKVPASSSLPSQ